MQLTTLHEPRVVDIEAQKNGELVNENFPISTSQKVRSYRPTSGRCKRACSCACHSVQRVKTPTALQGVFGSLLIKSNGLYGMSQKCNEYSCRRNCSTTVQISYRFPEWMLNRMVSSLITSNYLGGPQISLVVPRIVENTSEIFFHAFAGNIDGVAKLLEAGVASPRDISHTWGYTALHYAVDRGHMELCRFLLKAGASADITDIQDHSVTDMAWNKICSKSISSRHAAELEEVLTKILGLRRGSSPYCTKSCLIYFP